MKITDLHLNDLFDKSFLTAENMTSTTDNSVTYQKDGKFLKIQTDNNKFELYYTYSVDTKVADEFKIYVDRLNDDLFSEAVDEYGNADANRLNSLMKTNPNSSELKELISKFKAIVREIALKKIEELKPYAC